MPDNVLSLDCKKRCDSIRKGAYSLPLRLRVCLKACGHHQPRASERSAVGPPTDAPA